MAENKTRPTAISIASYIAALPDPVKQADAKALVKLMQSVTGEKPKMWGPSIIGFGTRHYRYESGREGDTPLVCFSPRKPAIVLYLYLDGSEKLLAKLGRHKIVGGCMYVKKLADVDMKVLEQLVVNSVTHSKAMHAAAAG